MQSLPAPAPESAAPESQLRFSLNYWCLWQSEPHAAEHCWPGGEVLPSHRGCADVGFLPMMQRRRLSPLARAACAVAWRCRQQDGDMPSVFFSSHGESQYYLEMLTGIADGESLSPSRFSLSVHNAVAGQYSIHGGSFLPYVALAGGTEGMFGAFVEAAGLLLETPKVLVVWYEQPLPKAYSAYLPCSETTWALAMVLSLAGEPSRQLRLTRRSGLDQIETQADSPDLVRAILNGRRNGYSQQNGSIWHWSLNDA
ncbi:beta-ketoacyl synthase chain length factor [Methylomonas sp. LL1]|uniref:beta-ketoacyl synthase chain length factor n=1 Tax=Methylomonas sp. LL1 TaxID=2785785 RepID=UPI0018C3FC24|nr:beta-ketoacyl synthase chain length factor [Methylomonas sp. LL1]QPK62189.1 beta-ketoacyl synthase chain length factor [Methylomonas sp. LL1]